MTNRRQSGSRTQSEILEWLSTEGVEAAAKAAVDVCRDEKAPAPARATAAGLIMRATALGGFGKNYEPAGSKDPWEMSRAELDASVEQLLRERDAINAPPSAFD